jgi:ribosomal protein S18 acetylase RimI-like enzyme
MAAVRTAVESDVPYLYEICLKTGDSGKDATGLFHDPYLLGQYYAAPYLFHDSGLCFVLEADNRPQGYIIAAADTTEFDRWRERLWLPPLRLRYPKPFPQEIIKSKMEESILNHLHTVAFLPDPELVPWIVDHPAHLHIDLLPAVQNRGFGRALMNALFAELARRGIPGIHLGVGTGNPSAIAFYSKMGFTVLQEAPWMLTLGQRIKPL